MKLGSGRLKSGGGVEGVGVGGVEVEKLGLGELDSGGQGS